MLVVPAWAAGRRRHHADRLVVDALYFVHVAVLPRRDADPLGPRIRIALALDADKHGGRGMRMSLRVAAVLVLADPEIEAVVGHERLDAPPSRGASVVQGKIAIHDSGDKDRAPHREAAHGNGLGT